MLTTLILDFMLLVNVREKFRTRETHTQDFSFYVYNITI